MIGMGDVHQFAVDISETHVGVTLTEGLRRVPLDVGEFACAIIVVIV